MIALLFTFVLIAMQWAQARREDRELERIDLTPRLALARPALYRRRRR